MLYLYLCQLVLGVGNFDFCETEKERCTERRKERVREKNVATDGMKEISKMARRSINNICLFPIMYYVVITINTVCINIF